MYEYQIEDFQHPQDSKLANDILSSKTAKTVLAKFQETNIEDAYTYLYQSL